MPLFAWLETLLAVTLWSTTPILVKIALAEASPFQIAAVRYFGGFLALLPFLIWRSVPEVRRLTSKTWKRLALLGVLSFPVANGLLFWGLRDLPATTSAFLLNGVPVFSLIIGARWLRESPNRWQWVGVAVAFLGAALFFRSSLEFGAWPAVAATLVATLAMGITGVMNRSLAGGGRLGTLVLVGLPMGIGGTALMLVAPPTVVFSPKVLLVLAWLAVLNSALAHSLVVHAQRRLKAFETGLAINLMPMGTAILSPLMLGESVSLWAWVGILVAMAGIFLVGLAGARPRQTPADALAASSLGPS
jgi:drug/metabolite transporter (DMT)-like permease